MNIAISGQMGYDKTTIANIINSDDSLINIKYNIKYFIDNQVS